MLVKAVVRMATASRASLLGLPYELRIKIYHFALKEHKQTLNLITKSNLKIALLWTSRQVGGEAARILFTNNSFCLSIHGFRDLRPLIQALQGVYNCGINKLKIMTLFWSHHENVSDGLECLIDLVKFFAGSGLKLTHRGQAGSWCVFDADASVRKLLRTILNDAVETGRRAFQEGWRQSEIENEFNVRLGGWKVQCDEAGASRRKWNEGWSRNPMTDAAAS